MGIFKKFCQAFNEFMAVPTARTPAKPGKQTNQAKQTTDLRGKKRNKKNKGQQAVPPKQAANQKFYYTGDDDGYGSITPVAGAFATGAAFGRFHDASLTWDSDSDIDSNISSGSQDLFQDDGLMSGSMEDMWGSSDPFSHQETRVGGFDGIIGPDSADLSEQAKWGSPMEDTFSSVDDTFSSMDDTFSSSIDDSFSSSFDSNSFGGNSWDD